MAFLEIVTRTFGQRPAALQRCIESIAQQTDGDYMHTIIRDDEGRGVAWAVGNLAQHVAGGDYVFVLDDDDVLVRRTLVAELKQIVAEHDPDVIMLRASHVDFGVLPHNGSWGREPQLGDVGTSCYVIRAATWDTYRGLWRPSYDGDWSYIFQLWNMPGLRWYWYDVVAAHYPQRSNGAAEHAH